MAYCVVAAQRTCAYRTISCNSSCYHFASLIVIVSYLFLLNACSGVSVPASSNPATAVNSTSSLSFSGALPTGVVGSSYSATLNVSGGTSPYVFSLASGQLPAGVLLESTVGRISGTPSAAGDFSFSISVSDAKNLTKQRPFQIAVSAAPVPSPPAPVPPVPVPPAPVTTKGNSFPNLQSSVGWAGYGQGPPDFVDCSPSPCDGISYSMAPGIKSPSMSGAATQYSLGGSAVYSDALFNNHLIGAFSSQGLPDNNQTLVATYHNFTYDVYFYGTNLELSQAVEFDINQFFDNLGFIWGHECRIAGGNEWDIWDNLSQHWVPTGIACHPNSNAWNHVTIQVQRTSSNELLYQSITLNGVTSAVNQYYHPGPAVNWYGITINYQMDGNYQQAPYTIYLDDLTFTYE
jgi:hypothetical protein